MSCTRRRVAGRIAFIPNVRTSSRDAAEVNVAVDVRLREMR